MNQLYVILSSLCIDLKRPVKCMKASREEMLYYLVIQSAVSYN